MQKIFAQKTFITYCLFANYQTNNNEYFLHVLFSLSCMYKAVHIPTILLNLLREPLNIPVINIDLYKKKFN